MRRILLGFSLALFGISAVVLTGAAGATPAASPAQQETFRATAQAVGTGPTGQTTTILTISRWSTDEERDALAAVLAEQGSNALAEALAKQDETGFIRFPQVQSRYPSVRLRYARAFPGENGGRTIVLATDRPIGWAEAVLRPRRTIDSQVSLIVLEVDAEGNGEGSMALGAELAIDEASDTLSVKSVSSQPVRLVNVRH
jgi:hypothetical protein